MLTPLTPHMTGKSGPLGVSVPAKRKGHFVSKFQVLNPQKSKKICFKNKGQLQKDLSVVARCPSFSPKQKPFCWVANLWLVNTTVGMDIFCGFRPLQSTMTHPQPTLDFHKKINSWTESVTTPPALRGFTFPVAWLWSNQVWWYMMICNCFPMVEAVFETFL